MRSSAIAPPDPPAETPNVRVLQSDTRHDKRPPAERPACALDAARAFGVTLGPSLLLDLLAVGSVVAVARGALNRPSRSLGDRLVRLLLRLGAAAPVLYLLVVRPWQRRWGATEAETRKRLPGDDLVPEPAVQCTRAVTINAPVDEVWPWLAQIGQDRGGFYSYEWLENLAGCQLHNADRVHPEWQNRAVGGKQSGIQRVAPAPSGPAHGRQPRRRREDGTKTQQPYIPALGLKWLLPAYDPLQRWIMREALLKGRLADEVQIGPGHDVLDVACGTGTLAILLQQREPQAHVVALDVDPQVLKRARQKAAAAGVLVTFTEGSGTALPYADSAFDCVVSSLAFHHLRRADKQRALAEVWRVLRPEGRLVLLDFGRPHTMYARAISLVLRQFEEVADNIAGQLPPMMSGAGFLQVRELGQYTTALGTISLYRGYRGSMAEEQDAD